MKKIKIDILVILFIASPFLALTQVKSDLYRHNLKEKVHTVLESEYNPVNNSGKTKEKNLQRKVFYEYDEQGNLIRLNQYDSKAVLFSYHTFLRDESGKRIATLHYNTGNVLVSIDSFKYDLNGNRTQDISYNIDHTRRGRLLSIYDGNGVITASFAYDGNGKLKSGYKFKLDSSGRRLGSEYINEDRAVVGTYVYKYSDFDRHGNWQKCVSFYNGSISVITTIRIEYY